MVFYWHCPITKAFLFLQASGPTRYPFSLREQTRKTNGAYICEVTEREHKNIHNGKTNKPHTLSLTPTNKPLLSLPPLLSLSRVSSRTLTLAFALLVMIVRFQSSCELHHSLWLTEFWFFPFHGLVNFDSSPPLLLLNLTLLIILMCVRVLILLLSCCS